MISVVNVNGGYAVDKHGELVYPSTSKNGSPFKTADAAWRFVKLQKLTKKDPFYQDAVIPEQILKTTAPEQPNRTHVPLSVNASASSPSLSSNDADYCRPQNMNHSEHEQVIKVYTGVTTKFTHSQLSCLSSLLFRFEQEWVLAEQLNKIKLQDESYERRTAWAHPATSNQNESSTSLTEDDELAKIEELFK